jgi:DNA repair exonuclease SbcCD nuclease subunit
MKFVLTADIHLHPHRQCSNDGGKDRLNDGLSVLRQTLEAAKERDCPWVFLGDLKHVKGVWHQEALNRAMNIFDMGSIRHVPKLMVHGNHDGIAGGSGLLPFKNLNNMTVIDKPMVFNWQGVMRNVAVWPHQYDISEMPEFLQEAKAAKAKVFLGHIFLADSVVGPRDKVIVKGARMEHIGLGEDKTFDWAFLGDVHKAQTLGSEDEGIAIYPGSPLALNWGELETDKGCLYVDTSKSSAVELIPIKAPRFRVFDFTKPNVPDPGSKELSEYEGDFVRVIVGPRTIASFVEEFRKASKPRWFQAIVRQEDADVEKRSEVHAGMSRGDMLTEYVKVRPLEGVEEEKLVNVGLKLMEEG